MELGQPEVNKEAVVYHLRTSLDIMFEFSVESALYPVGASRRAQRAAVQVLTDLMRSPLPVDRWWLFVASSTISAILRLMSKTAAEGGVDTLYGKRHGSDRLQLSWVAALQNGAEI